MANLISSATSEKISTQSYQVLQQQQQKKEEEEEEEEEEEDEHFHLFDQFPTFFFLEILFSSYYFFHSLIDIIGTQMLLLPQRSIHSVSVVMTIL